MSDRPTEGSTTRPIPPEGADGDGLEDYPTYHDRPGETRPVGGTKPTDSNLPESRKTYSFPIMIGLAVFAAVIIIRIVWGMVNVADTTDAAMTPGDAATPPAASAPASPPSQ